MIEGTDPEYIYFGIGLCIDINIGVGISVGIAIGMDNGISVGIYTGIGEVPSYEVVVTSGEAVP